MTDVLSENEINEYFQRWNSDDPYALGPNVFDGLLIIGSHRALASQFTAMTERAESAEEAQDALLEVIHEAKNSLLSAHARAALKRVDETHKTTPVGDDRISVTRKDDGLWLCFGPNSSISLDAILDGRGPLVASDVRAFCEAHFAKYEPTSEEK